MNPVTLRLDKETVPVFGLRVTVSDEKGRKLLKAEDACYESDAATKVVEMLEILEKSGAVRLITITK